MTIRARPSPMVVDMTSTIAYLDSRNERKMQVTPLNPWPWPTPEPGIYFNMPFDEYLAIPCLQSSAIKRLLISETDFWTNSWLNPFLDQIKEKKEARHFQDGRAYHTRILEGRDMFLKLYAPDYEDDPKDQTIIRNSDDLKAALRLAGLPVTFKTKDEGARRLLAAKPHARVLDAMKAKHRAGFEGKELIPASGWRYIELAASMIDHHPELKTYFAGGFPEMTVIWDDPDFGVRFKIRVDYQKVGPPVDLKSFTNKSGRPIGKAIRREIDNYLYVVQAWLYLRGVNYAKAKVRSGEWEFYNGETGQIYIAPGVTPEWLTAFAAAPAEEFCYVFVQKGDAPVSRGVKLSMRDPGFAGVGNEYIRPAVQLFHHCYKIFGEDPWVDVSPSEYIAYDELWGW